MITSCHLFNERTMTSVQKCFKSQFHISDNLQPMRSSSTNLLLDVHSSPQSYNGVYLQLNTNANDDITIGFIYSFDNLILSAAPSYSHCVRSSLENNVKSSLLPGHRARTPHRYARRRRRLQRQHRTPQSGMLQTSLAPNVCAVGYHIPLSSPKVDSVYRARCAVRRSLNLSDGELFEYNASINFATI